MKKALTLLMTITGLSLAGSGQMLAQEPPAPPVPPAPVAIVHSATQIAQDAAQMAQVEVQKVQDQVQENIQVLQQRLSKIGDGPYFAGKRAESGSSGKSLVIRSHEMDAGEQGNLEEDLTVMTHILDKAVSEKVDDAQPGRTIMGISVVYGPGESRVRNMYLDGYGAVFIMNVNFPLLPRPADKDMEKEKTQEDSAWDEARREVYGQPNSWAAAPGAGQKYDEEKVGALKDALVDSLKNAANIRGLKSDDWITLCVFGSAAGQPKARAKTSGGGGFGAISNGSGGGESYGHSVRYLALGGDGSEGKTTMTIRVKKADVDGLVKGKLAPEAFRSRAVVTTYGGSISGS